MYNKYLVNNFAIFFLFFFGYYSICVNSNKDINRLKKEYEKNNTDNSAKRHLDLFLQLNILNSSKLSGEINSFLKNGNSNNKIYQVKDELYAKNEKLAEKRNLKQLIENELKLDKKPFPKDISIYFFQTIRESFSYSLPKFISSSNQIRKFKYISGVLSFEPKEIYLHEKRICIPTMIFLNIKKITKKKLIIQEVKSDIYQLNTFLYQESDNNLNYINPNLSYPKEIQTNVTFQLIILPDFVGELSGHLFIKFISSQKPFVVAYPIKLTGIPNEYRVKPIYFQNWVIYQKLSHNIEIFNPYNSTLLIKEVINSFTNINLLWPNGTKIGNNGKENIIKIQPGEEKKIINLNYYQTTQKAEYGLVQIKTDRDTLIIPVLIKANKKFLTIFPTRLLFGCFSGKDEEIRAIPLYIGNNGKRNISVKGLYLKYQTKEIEFIPVTAHENYCEINKCKIEHDKFVYLGHVTINPQKIDFSKYSDDKKVEGKLLLETTIKGYKFIEINYEYYVVNSFKKPRFSFYVDAFDQQNEVSKIIKMNFPHNFGYAYRDFTLPDNPIISEEFEEAINVKFNLINENDIELRFSIKNIEKFSLIQNKKFYYLPIQLNEYYYSVIPVSFYDGLVDLYLCKQDNCSIDDYEVFNKINVQSIVREINVNFNESSSRVNILQKKFFFENLNDRQIEIYIEDNVEDVLFVNSKNQNIKKKKVTLKPFSKFYFTIAIQKSSEKMINSVCKIRFIQTNSIIYFNIKVNILDGKLSIFSEDIKNIGKSGFLLFGSSLYSKSLKILDLKTNCSEISITQISNEVLQNHNTTIAKIKLKERKNTVFENNFFRHSFLKYRELYQWQQIKEIKKEKSFVTCMIILTTDISTEKVLFDIDKRQKELVQYKVINFGEVQIGQRPKRYIEVTNPTDSVLVIQPILSPKKFFQKNYTLLENKVKYFKDFEENFTILNCYFDNIIKEKEQNFLFDDNPKKPGNLNLDLTNAIIINEDIFIHNYDSETINSIIYTNSTQKIKQLIDFTERMICKVNVLTKRDILLKGSKSLLELFFTKSINQDILPIQELTENNLYQLKDIRQRFYQKKVCFSHYSLIRRRLDPNTRQEIFLAKSQSNPHNIYYLRPNQTIVIGPIVYIPNQLTSIDSFLLIKNNYTFLTPVVIKGHGKIGIPEFYSSKGEKFTKEYTFEITEEKKIQKLTIKNIGDIPLYLDKITFENGECHENNFKLLNCSSLVIRPNSYIDLFFAVEVNYDFWKLKSKIRLSSEVFGVHNLIIIALVHKTLFKEKNKIFDFRLTFFKEITFFYVLGGVLLLFISASSERHKENKNLVLKNRVPHQKDLENMIIKSYRRDNFEFYEEVMMKIDEDKTGGAAKISKNKKSKKVFDTKKSNLTKPEFLANVSEGAKKTKGKKQKGKPSNIVGISEQQKGTQKETKKMKIKLTHAPIYIPKSYLTPNLAYKFEQNYFQFQQQTSLDKTAYTPKETENVPKREIGSTALKREESKDKPKNSLKELYNKFYAFENSIYDNLEATEVEKEKLELINATNDKDFSGFKQEEELKYIPNESVEDDIHPLSNFNPQFSFLNDQDNTIILSINNDLSENKDIKKENSSEKKLTDEHETENEAVSFNFESILGTNLNNLIMNFDNEIEEDNQDITKPYFDSINMDMSKDFCSTSFHQSKIENQDESIDKDKIGEDLDKMFGKSTEYFNEKDSK